MNEEMSIDLHSVENLTNAVMSALDGCELLEGSFALCVAHSELYCQLAEAGLMTWDMAETNYRRIVESALKDFSNNRVYREFGASASGRLQ
jgi:hypothetical protein